MCRLHRWTNAPTCLFFALLSHRARERGKKGLLSCTSHPPFYLSPNEQFTWLVKEVVKPAKEEGKQRGGCAGVHFPQVERLSPVLQDVPLFPGVSAAGCGRTVGVYTLCKTLKERMASIHNSKRETIFKMKEHAINSAGRLPLFCPPPPSPIMLFPPSFVFGTLLLAEHARE